MLTICTAVRQSALRRQHGIGDDNSVWYANDHYYTFTKVNDGGNKVDL